MANFSSFADDAIKFAMGFNHALRPTASKASLKIAKETGKITDNMAKEVLSHGAGKNGMKTAEAIMKNKTTTGIASTIHHMDGGKGFKDALRTAHLTEDGSRLSKSKMAGTAFTAGVTGRVATGGGLYRDRYGNINIPGVPFI